MLLYFTDNSVEAKLLLEGKLTSPESPLDAKVTFKLLGEEEVEDASESGKGES